VGVFLKSCDNRIIKFPDWDPSGSFYPYLKFWKISKPKNSKKSMDLDDFQVDSDASKLQLGLDEHL
jgi:hypothetical protein